MGVFSGMKQSMAAAKEAMRMAEEAARQAGHSAPTSSSTSTSTFSSTFSPASSPETMASQRSTPIPSTHGSEQPLQSWATAGATVPYTPPPMPAPFAPEPVSSPGYPGSAFGGGYPTAPASSSPTQAMIIQQMMEASSPPPRGRRRLWPSIALVLAVGGGVMLAIGIISLVRHNSEIRSSAIVTGRVGPADNTAETYQFVVDNAQAYSVHIDVETNEENRRDAVINATECIAAFEDGTTALIRGSRQASSSSIGDLSSIGYFDAPAGRAAIRCTQQPLIEAAPFYLSPGTTNDFLAIGLTVGGALLLALAMVVLIRGVVSKQRVRVQRIR